MESDRKDAVATCPWCKKRPATSMYNSRNGKISAMFCQICLDRNEIQDALEWGIVDRFPLAEAERWDEILAWLDELEAANHHRDHDGWLARSVASERELTLWRAGRYEEALQACDVVEQLGFEDNWHRYAARVARANVLEGLGRHEEALAVYEEALRNHAEKAIESARHALLNLVDFATNAGKPVDESWRELAKTVAVDYEVEVPIRPTLAESITALFELTENKLSSRQRAEQAK
jgi:tetratricopeptide (TPR) repeat protein